MPPDTGSYLILGLIVTVVLMLALMGSMAARYRSLQKDLELIEQLKRDDR